MVRGLRNRGACLCGCDFEEHAEIYHYSCAYCGATNCPRYRSVTAASVMTAALAAVTFALPISGALLVYVFMASESYISAGILALIVMAIFVGYRNALLRRIEHLAWSRRRRKARRADGARVYEQRTKRDDRSKIG